MPLPALLTIQSGINQLRYATLKGIMAAKKKEIRVVAPAAPVAARQRIVALAMPQKAKQTAMIGGTPAEAAQRAGPPAARRGAGPVILVVAEQKDGRLNRASWEAIAAAQALAGGQTPITVACSGGAVQDAAAELARPTSPRVWTVTHDGAGRLHAGCLRGGAGRRRSPRLAPTPRVLRAHLPDARLRRRRWRRGSIGRWSPTWSA